MITKKLDNNSNYIVSGLERSGTSMLMQILNSGGIPISYDNSRPADEHNPKGYFELEGGKIINKIIERSFPIEKYKGNFIKITSYGIKFLPKGKYKIIYSERNIEEVLFSMENMMGKKDDTRLETKKCIIKLNNLIKKEIRDRKDIEYLIVNYNKIIKNPKINIIKILDFLNINYDNLDLMIDAVDINLYNPRRV